MSLRALMDYTFTAKYSRYLTDRNRRETWKEANDRVRKMMLDMYQDKPEVHESINWAYDMMHKKKVLGSQRALQFGGDPIFKHHARIYNCVSSYVDRLRFFQECMYLLLCGCGAGFSVQKHHIAKLPPLLSISPDGNKKFVIEDNIEGWSDAIGVLVSSYFEQSELFPEYNSKNIVFDFSKIRLKGAPLSNGGKAPGPEPLRKALKNIKKILDAAIARVEFNASSCRLLKPIEAYDIVMHFSDAVISGGVRRSATICVFSPDDEEMATAKTGNWFVDNPQRGRSNNSALLIRNKTTREEFSKLMKSVKEFGEPGFIWSDSTELIVNPCVEIGMYPVDIETGLSGWQGCVMGNTPLITKDGMIHIQDSVAKQIEIWNGQEWSSVTPIITGVNREMYRVQISDGSFLDCTENHKWIANDKELTTLELIKELNNKNKLFINRPNISGKTGRKEEFAYEYGFILGDGSIRENHSPSAQLFKDDNILGLRCSKTGPHKDNKHSVEYYRAHFTSVNKKKASSIKNEFGLPREVFEWDKSSISEFMAGWIDADGSKANDGCRLYGQEDKLRYAQVLLTSIGINSSINLHSKKGTKTNISIRKKDLWYLQIPNAKDIPSRRIDLSNGKDPVRKGSKIYIKNIEKLDGLHTSYCFEESKLHKGTFGNILTKQCNLSTINCAKVTKEEDFYDACEAAAVIGTLQAGFTRFPYLGEVSERIFARESLLGVSGTGWLETPEICLNTEVQKRGAEVVKETNARIAQIIGIPQAARTTCVKPEGSSSCVLGTASGIHPHHAKRYIRRVQANKLENVYAYFREQNPRACEQSVWSANNTDDVISFCVEVPDGSKTKNQVCASSLLEIVKSTQQNWVITGTNLHLCTQPWLVHNVSNTINVQDDEWDYVEDFIYENRKYFCGISLLPATGDKDYPQAPFTTVYLPSEMLSHYGEGVMFVSGLIEGALNSWDNNLWSACSDALRYLAALKLTPEITIDLQSNEQIKLSQKQVEWIVRCDKYAFKYFEGDLKKLTYCMKDVYNYKLWTELQREYQHVDYTNLVESEDNTELEQALACAGGKCEF